MPLTETVTFTTSLQKGNRIQLPRLVRWEYKLEPNQVLKVTVSPTFSWAPEIFLAKMTRDGRLTIPKLAIQAFKELAMHTFLKDEEESVVGLAFEVTISPVKPTE